jgi:putative transposase
MATRNITISADEYYHIYNRGVEKRIIFLDTQDKNYFIQALYAALSDFPMQPCRLSETDIFSHTIEQKLVSIGAYTLMPNHFHILVRVKDPKDLSLFMNRLQTSYAMYFNKKYERSGRLFEGTYKAKHIADDTYLQYLFAYIHLNPIKIIDKTWKEKGLKDITKAQAFLNKYQFSSYLDYVTVKRPETRILDKTAFPAYFKKKYNMKEYVTWWLEYRKSDYDPLRLISQK